MQVDAERLLWLSYQLVDVLQMPLVLGISFTFFFYYYGVYFFAGLAVFALAIVVNFGIGMYYAYQEKIYMRRKDRRMKVTTESINNIKMLKLYAWQDSFLQRILRRREKELITNRKINNGWAIAIAGIYFFPNLLPVVTFSTFIGTEHTLDLNVAAATLIIFDLMTETMITVPYFFSEIINLLVSIRRIEGFLGLDEVQDCIVEKDTS